MRCVLIDQDITPTDRPLDSLDDGWETTVGINGDEETLLNVASR